MLAVDVGGTFTDVVRLHRGCLEVRKVRTRAEDPAAGVEEAICGIDPGKKHEQVRHGTTLVTNALLEGKGARTAFLTTSGFEDVIELGRQNRLSLYEWENVRPPVLVPASLRKGLPERMDERGKVLTSLTEGAVREAVRWAKRKKLESAAVGFLFSYENASHERRLVRRLRATGIPACASHELHPRFREYERFLITCLNARALPLMQTYVRRLQRLPGRKWLFLQSNAGALPPVLASSFPALTVLSGPAGGVLGAVRYADRLDLGSVLTLDMGGTSTDVALCPGRVPWTERTRVGPWPFPLPSVDVQTVGAGGGSIARVGDDGVLRVGPQSAGADPGPACYGKGLEATVTDAHVVAGHLGEEGLVGGEKELFPERSWRAVARIARRLRLSSRKAAEGILELARDSIEKALRVVSVRRGQDPRGFVLFAFGGAGPLHAAPVAERLGIRRVYVPPFPGAFSAIGMLHAEVTRDVSRNFFRLLSQTKVAERQRAWKELERHCRRQLRSAGVSVESLRWERSVSCRYEGQSHELRLGEGTRLRERFDAVHEEHFGHSDPAGEVEIVALHLRGIVRGRRQRVTGFSSKEGPDRGRSSRRVLERGRWVRACCVQREGLRPGERLAGPALILEYSATTWLPPRWQGRVDELGGLQLRRG